ncbi:MAG: hypothetical protein ABIP51_23190 [Bacteroidia bacterium]
MVSRFKIVFLVVIALMAISCINTTIYDREINIGAPKQVFKLNVSGANLQSFINAKLVSDTSRNLIAQLGKYKFSTSADPSNAGDNRYSPDAYIYYDYEGLQLKYIFEGGGSFQREQLQSKIEEFKKYVYLYEIYFEPKVYKGTLPYQLTSASTPCDVEKILGKHNPSFDGGSKTRKINYEYPEHGLYLLFNFYLSDVMVDSTINILTLRDSIKEMKRHPTFYPNIK